DHALVQKTDADVPVAVSNGQDNSDAVPDAMPVAIDSDTELEEDFIVNEEDCTIAILSVPPVAFEAGVIVPMNDAEQVVSIAIAPSVQAVLSPADIVVKEFDKATT